MAKGAAMAKPVLKEIVINRAWCKGCGICVHFCPAKVLGMDGMDKAVVERPDDCICCMMCELRCPDLAVTVMVDHRKEAGA
jgi:2-oxoglutarate ferredoxin oxidoreductase subunit delta